MSKRTKAEERAAKAAAALAERKRKERRRNILVAVGVVAVIALIVAAGFLFSRSEDKESDKAASQESDYGVTIGDADAPHTIIIYEDFLCPVCRDLEAATRDDLAKLAADGKVEVDYRPFNLFQDEPLKDYSVASAAAFAVVLEQSGAEVAKEFHDLLYENQPPEPGPYPDTDWFVDLAVDAGATESEVREGIENGAGEGWVEDATRAAQAAGVSGTPTILLDGEQFLDGRTMEELGDNLVAAVE